MEQLNWNLDPIQRSALGGVELLGPGQYGPEILTIQTSSKYRTELKRLDGPAERSTHSIEMFGQAEKAVQLEQPGRTTSADFESSEARTCSKIV